jgi:hypothetical protein
MPKHLTGSHAEDVGGGLVVEPGHEIPASADPETVKRLQTDGLLSTASQPKPKPEED